MTETKCPKCNNRFDTTEARRSRIVRMCGEKAIRFEDLREEILCSDATLASDLHFLKTKGDIEPVFKDGAKRWKTLVDAKQKGGEE